MKKYELAVPATLEAQELRELERRTDARLDRVKAAERRAAILEDKLRQEREAHRREIEGLATFVTVACPKMYPETPLSSLGSISRLLHHPQDHPPQEIVDIAVFRLRLQPFLHVCRNPNRQLVRVAAFLRLFNMAGSRVCRFHGFLRKLHAGYLRPFCKRYRRRGDARQRRAKGGNQIRLGELPFFSWIHARTP